MIKKEEIKKRIYELADNKYKEFHSNLCPGTNNIIGVRVPVLRQYAKEIFDYKTWKSTIKQIDDEFYEEIMLQGMLIGMAKKENINDIFCYIDEYVPKIYNWAICDTFCAGLKITKKNKNEMWNYIQKYLNSNKEFDLRFVIVMILDYFIDDEYLQRDFEIFDRIKSDDYYVKMAVAWTISICLIKYYDETIRYMNKTEIDDWTYNKAIQKAIESYRISNEKKENLRKMKK